MKNKKIRIIVFQIIILLIFCSNLISQSFVDEKKGFNIIETNELKITDYSFTEFMDDYNINATFVCINPSTRLGTDYHDQYSITDMKSALGKYCRLEKFSGINDMGERIYDSESVIELNSENFSEFREKFITGNCLQFHSGFPVKFMKVKTVYKAGDIDFHYMPGDELVIEDAPKNNVIYYAYKKTKIGDKEYVYLGTKNYFSTETKSDIRKTLIGWVLYEDQGKSKNVVLWNTDIGLRPMEVSEKAEFNRQPVVFLNDKIESATTYYENGTEPTTEDLLVSSTGLEQFHEEYEENKGKSFRWLPMYDKNLQKSYVVNVGVIDSLYVYHRERVEVTRMEELRVAFLIDASKSMKQIWDNLDKVLVNVLSEVVNQNFTNIANEPIELKIKIYYFADELHLLNSEQYISSAEDVNRYKKNIKNISENLEYTEYLLPSIYKFYNNVYEDMDHEEFITIVIGDAGDYQYEQKFSTIPEIVERARHDLIPIFGVSFNSQFYYDSPFWTGKEKNEVTINESISKESYENTHMRFLQNFNIIDSVENPKINKGKIEEIGDSISTKIVGEIQYVIDQLIKEFKPQQKSKTGTPALTGSVFSQIWLDELNSKLTNPDMGTYFEEGIILDKDRSDNPLLKKDVIVEVEKIEKLNYAITKFRNVADDSNFKRLLRKMLAIFFEIDYSEVNDKLLRETTLADFWQAVVGDKEIAQKIIPELFEHDAITFKQIGENWINYKSEIKENAQNIKNQIIYQTDNKFGLYQTLLEYATKDGITQYIDYYWVDVNELRLFKDIDFNAIQE